MSDKFSSLKMFNALSFEKRKKTLFNVKLYENVIGRRVILYKFVSIGKVGLKGM